MGSCLPFCKIQPPTRKGPSILSSLALREISLRPYPRPLRESSKHSHPASCLTSENSSSLSGRSKRRRVFRSMIQKLYSTSSPIEIASSPIQNSFYSPSLSSGFEG